MNRSFCHHNVGQGCGIDTKLQGAAKPNVRILFRVSVSIG